MTFKASNHPIQAVPKASLELTINSTLEFNDEYLFQIIGNTKPKNLSRSSIFSLIEDSLKLIQNSGGEEKVMSTFAEMPTIKPYES